MFGQLRRIEHGSGEEPGDDERQGQRVGEQPSSDVDPGESNKPPTQQAIEPDPGAAIDDRGTERDGDGGKFDSGIEPAEGMPAIAAAPAGSEPTVERHEITRSEPRPAPFAARS